MQTARDWRVRPLEFFGVEQAGSWTETDRALTEALTIYERSLCPDCGRHSSIAFDPDTNGWFEVDDSTVCEACAARERWQDDNKDMEPGQKVRVVLDPEYRAKKR